MKKKDCVNTGTLCWSCANAVPSADGKRGCSWSIGLKPVKGWDAVKSVKTYNIYGVYNKTQNEFVLNKQTNLPIQYSARKLAMEAIERLKEYSTDDFTVQILRTDENVSYRVITCPKFIRG